MPNLAYERSNRPGSSAGYTRCSRSHCPSWGRASRSQDLALQGRVRDSLMVRTLVWPLNSQRGRMLVWPTNSRREKDLAGPVGRSGGMGCTGGELMMLVLEMRRLALRWAMGRVGGSAIGLSRGRCNCEAGLPLSWGGGTDQSTCNRHTS